MAALQHAERGAVPLHLLHNVLLTRTGSNGWTALHKAAGRGHVDVVRLLLEHGADVNAKGAKCVRRAA